MIWGKNNKKINTRLHSGRPVDSRLNRQKAWRKKKAFSPAQILRKIFLPVTKFVCVFTLTGLLLLAGYVGLAHSSFFELRQMEIKGSRHLSRLDILSAAGLGYHSNLISLNPEQVEAGIRELPWITQVSVRRALPGKIEINVQEEIPYAIGLIEGELFYLNGTLKPFAPFAYDGQLKLPIVSGLSRAELLREDEELEEILACGIKVLSLAAKFDEPLWGKVSQINLSPQQGMYMVFENVPATIKLGRDIDEKQLRQLHQVTMDLARRGELERAVLIDLSIEKRVVVRLGRKSI